MSKTLTINLDTNNVFGSRSLLKRMNYDDIAEVDTDMLSEDSEGNAEGTISIFLKPNGDESECDIINIQGESFSPLLMAYSAWAPEEQKVLIEELKEKLEREMK